MRSTLTSDVHADLHALPPVHKLVPVAPAASVVEQATLPCQRVEVEAPLAGLAGALLPGQQAETWGPETCKGPPARETHTM